MTRPAVPRGHARPILRREGCTAPPPFQGTACYRQGLLVGLDVGSTTVKAVVVEPASDTVLWKDYRRHETKQAEMGLDFLERIMQAFPGVPPAAFRIFTTGSGGAAIGELIGAHHVQEVNAVSLAVERRHPEARSVVELGGQDAKIIVIKAHPATGAARKFPSMNDKCAGGTGAVIDKIAAKLGFPIDQLASMRYRGLRLHPVAGKCGVFAETDINGLQKQGVPADELMASLFESIIQQNLSVLTRGHTLLPKVLLLGGPNFHIPGMRECWQHHIPRIWEERGVEIPAGACIDELILVPEDAHYFAALGAVEFGRTAIEDRPDLSAYAGTGDLQWYIEEGRVKEKARSGARALAASPDELEAFRGRYAAPSWHAPRLQDSPVFDAFLGLDGGSTSTKAVVIDRERRLVAKAYQLSRGNPIEDAKEVLGALRGQIEAQGGRPHILGAATTGYAKDILRDVLAADIALVETVAHARSGLHYRADADVICDVGGQDIKVILLKNGVVKDFKLNTQCSAGNGYYLQATAEAFGYDVSDYAEVAFGARAMPEFGYGCAVFMQSDIVDFQRRGWQPNEILAGLAAVLPKNIWLYVCQIPNMARLGSTFLLQGGTQRNLAAVKAQVDFIGSRFQGTGIEPEVIVHPHCAECGAFGCAIETARLYDETPFESSFIGLEAVPSIQYRTTRNESTRCSFCRNACMRTFIDVRTSAHPGAGVDMETHRFKQGAEEDHPSRIKHGPGQAGSAAASAPPPLAPGERRLIIATCEKGTVENAEDMQTIVRDLRAICEATPNLADEVAREVFRPAEAPCAADPLPGRMARALNPRARRRHARMRRRDEVRIGMPRVLNMFSLAPFFMGYFQSLGIPAEHLVWSPLTTDRLYREGAKRGSIDPCFPSKVCIPHIHHLLHSERTRGALTHIFFPMVDTVPSMLHGTLGCRTCPTSAATPEASHAAFIKEGDLFEAQGIVFKKTFLNLDHATLAARQLHQDWEAEIGVTEAESNRAVQAGFEALARFQQRMRDRARMILERLERENRIGIVLLGRPYHNDPGIHHGVCEEFQKLGYPLLTHDALPTDPDILDRLFGEEVARGVIPHPLSIDDVWKNSYSENSCRKVWAAKFTARHPHLVALELSSFKCGHDAPIYSVIEEIIERSETPYFCFKDIDENKPSGSIRIRIETIAYFLRRHHERLLAAKFAPGEVEALLRAFEAQLPAAVRSSFSVEASRRPRAIASL